jgi:hypothetical protein
MLAWVLAAALFGEPWAAVRPKCTKELAGQFWPPAANVSATVRNRAAQCGDLHYCGRDVWRHRWETVSLPYWKLTKTDPPAICAGPATALALVAEP